MRLRELRKARGMKQIELCQHLGVSQGNLSNWENGVYEPDTYYLKKIADFFGVSVDYLLGHSDSHTISIPSDGVIFMPIIGSVRAGADKLEDEIVQKFCEIVSAPKKRSAVINAVIAIFKENANGDTIKLIKAAYNKAKHRRDNTVNAIAEMGANAALQAKLNELENEMQSLLGELERAKKGAITKEKVERRLLDILSAPTDRLKDRILKDLVVRVVCYKDHNEVFFTTTQPPLPPSNPSESSNNSSCGSPNYALFELNLAVYVGFVVLRIEK